MGPIRFGGVRAYELAIENDRMVDYFFLRSVLDNDEVHRSLVLNLLVLKYECFPVKQF